MQADYSSPVYRRSRGAYHAQCAFEYFVYLLVMDAFLAKLLTSIGLSDSLTGIVSSLISLAFLSELLTLPLMRRVKSYKRTCIASDVVSMLLFAGAYALPLLPLSREIKTVLAFLFIGGGSIFRYAVSSMYFVWANSFVHPENRARYSAVKEMISLIAGILFSLAVGVLFDRYEAAGDLNGCFTVVSLMILALNAISFLCLSLIGKERPEMHESNDITIREAVKGAFSSRGFRNSVIAISLWRCAEYMTISFLGTYKTGELGFDFTTIQIINMVSCLFRFAFSLPFGAYSDRTSCAKGLKLAFIIAAAGFAVNAFAAPGTRWFIAVYTVLFSVSQAGAGQNCYNILYSYVDSRYVAQAMAIKEAIAGTAGFIASMAGGKLLAIIQANGNTLFGMHIYGQQVLSFISLLLTAACIVYTGCVLEKQPVVKK